MWFDDLREFCGWQTSWEHPESSLCMLRSLVQEEKRIIQFTDDCSHAKTQQIFRSQFVRSSRFVDLPSLSTPERSLEKYTENSKIYWNKFIISKFQIPSQKHSTTEQTFDEMTKLTEWLSGLVVFFGVYWILVTRKVSNQFTEDFFFHIQISPIVIVLLLGVSWGWWDGVCGCDLIIKMFLTSGLCCNYCALSNIDIQWVQRGSRWADGWD